MPGVIERARRQPSAILLAVQLLGVLIYPYLGESRTGTSAVSLFGLLVLALAVWSVETTPWTVWVSIVLGVPAVIFTLCQIASTADVWHAWGSAFEAAFYFYAAGSLIAYMLADRTITRDELFAVGATFTLLAWAFAHLFTVTQVVWPGSFTAAVHADAPRTWMELLFLSFTTLSSTGLSDVVPVRPHARSFVMIEQLAGLAYVAMVVSWMVGLTVARARARDEVARARAEHDEVG
ncbi:ion channel [Jatrophihabitans sp.]|uniref:ion channel n=1 Tax=Jatrophihabitans sp. TaxID=1932789 RepID=UPI002C06507E|nr:potassium channel family protein [Jatrophihabitans sp.]